jgi:hypothetical protein
MAIQTETVPTDALIEQERERAQARARSRARQSNYGPAHVAPVVDVGEVKRRCMFDPIYFINHFVQIEDPQSETSNILPFKLWPRQEDVLQKFLSSMLLIVLKARQLGLSWLVCAYALWLAMFKNSQLILIFSKGQLEATEMVRRITQIYSRLPDWMRRECPISKEKIAELEWANGSRIKSLPSTSSGGRSYTASLVVMDEAAFMFRPRELYSALKPTIDGGGQLIIISTFGKLGDFFHDTWERAKQRANNFVPVFLSWRARPDRTEEWRERVRSEAASVALDMREYPEFEEDCMVAIETERYLPDPNSWKVCGGVVPMMPTPIILGIDGAYASGGDSFGVVGVGLYPTRRDMLVVYLARKWQAAPDEPPLKFHEIEQEIIKICRTRRVVHIAYDPKDLHQMAGNLTLAGLTVEPFDQGADRWVSDKALLDRINNGKIIYDPKAPFMDDLAKHLGNADRRYDRDGKYVRIQKRSRNEKIDLAVSLSMACQRAEELWAPGLGGLSLGKAKSTGWLGLG